MAIRPGCTAANLIFSWQRRHGFGIWPTAYSAMKLLLTSRALVESRVGGQRQMDTGHLVIRVHRTVADPSVVRLRPRPRRTQAPSGNARIGTDPKGGQMR
jgi:hypothetical protein